MALRINLKAISRTSALLERKRFPIISSASYSQDNESYRVIENTDLSATKRGTGFRSSFNGTVCTVFGSTGLIGPGLVNRLGRNGTQIIIAYRGSPYDAHPVKVATDLGQMYFTHFHLKDEESIRRAVKHSNVVVNLIGQDCNSMNFKLEDVHIDGARRIAKICREMGVKKLIHMSSMGVSPNPKIILQPGGSRFLKSKYYGELAVREEFPDAIIVRPADVYGEMDRYLTYYTRPQRMLFRKIYLHEKGVNTVKAPLYVDDCIEGIFELVFRPQKDVAGKTYQFVGPQHYRLDNLVRYIYDSTLRTEKHRFEILDSRLSALFQLMLWIRNTAYLVKPGLGIHIERFERENTSDVMDKNLPTLADLGVSATKLDRHIISLTRPFRLFPEYTDDVFEFDFPDLPPTAQPVYS